jgi:hypothetical protein
LSFMMASTGSDTAIKTKIEKNLRRIYRLDSSRSTSSSQEGS